MLIVEVLNDGGRHRASGGELADYDYVVRVNDRRICQGKVLGHRRSLGWRELIRRVLEDGK